MDLTQNNESTKKNITNIMKKNTGGTGTINGKFEEVYNVFIRATKEQQEMQRRMKEEREKYNELRIAKRQQTPAETLLTHSPVQDSPTGEDEKYREYLLSNFENKHPTQKEEEDIEIGPKLVKDKTHQILLKKKVRGRGSIGSNRLDQYFAGVPSHSDSDNNISDSQSHSQSAVVDLTESM